MESPSVSKLEISTADESPVMAAEVRFAAAIVHLCNTPTAPPPPTFSRIVAVLTHSSRSSPPLSPVPPPPQTGPQGSPSPRETPGSPDLQAAPLPHAELVEAVRRQVEYYFSKENLQSDAYLTSQMDASMSVPIAVVMKFAKMKVRVCGQGGYFLCFSYLRGSRSRSLSLSV